MADALVSSLVNTILENLNSLSMRDIGLVGGLKTEVENLESTLTTIQAVLQDAEEKQLKSEAIKNWLGKLKKVTYDLEDILDDFQIEGVRRSMHMDGRSRVSTFFSLHNPVLFRLKMARQFKNIREKLDAIAGERTKFHLKEGVTEVEILRREERQTSSLVTESEICGRENETEKLVNMLLINSSDYVDLYVFAICGMGGLGKTTMAQLIYNDENVRKTFDLRVWVCVSDDFDTKRLTKAIVESIEGNSCNIQELDPLQRHLEEKLVGKRFLLVLDDVWNESCDKWDRLKEALRRGAKGSSVIVTTRIEKVALMMATVPVYRLGCLSDDDSWLLFKQRAFGMVRDEDKGNLEPIGRQIAKKCGGVPLAIKAVGSIMCFKSQESEWLHVKDSNIWDLEDEGSRMLAVLRLSYEHLPPYMRQCFSFCSVFPKDYVMAKQQLIELWMANGFIPSREAMDLHEMGCEIFNQLTWRSFFQEVEEDNDGNVKCKMHDLIHDVATSIMGHECSAIDPNEELKIPKNARHLFLDTTDLSNRKLVEILNVPSSLRSFMQEEVPTFRHFKLHKHKSFPKHKSFLKHKHLKVLHVSQFKLIAVDHLKHLRYLNFSYSLIFSLPEPISCLPELQTLNLRDCDKICKLPKGMTQLKNLRYLDIKGCNLTSMPIGLGHLSSLRKLTLFVVGNDDGCGIEELKDLTLEGELSIENLYKLKSSAEAKKSNLIGKQNLRSLSLFFGCFGDENDEGILNGLQPHSNLKKLCIRGYQGLRFSHWMMDLLLPNLVEIRIESCERCDQLPPLGKLRFLKELIISGMNALKSIDRNFYGDGESSFLCLEILEMRDLECLEEWTLVDGMESFSRLRSLSISNCRPNLVKLPKLQSLKRLSIENSSVTLLKEVMRNASILNSLTSYMPELREIPDGLFQSHNLARFSGRFPSLKSLPNLPDNLSSLKRLDLWWCYELESLPAGLQKLSSLEKLNLFYCDSLVTLPINGLQDLSSLSSLKISSCKKLASLSEGLQYLTSLQSLSIFDCPELTSLPKSIQHLSSLQSLRNNSLDGLITLPDEIEHLASLSALLIWRCPNLMCLPQGMRSLTALQTLTIGYCPHLERRCKERSGEDWPYISHIPSVKIISDHESRGHLFKRIGDWTCGLSR